MLQNKVITKSGSITIPRVMRQETGLLAGVPVEVTSDEMGIHIVKHVPACCHCGTVDDVKEICGIEICRSCAGKITEGFA